MPTNRKYDFLLGGLGFMLSRATPQGGRSWQRSGVPDTPTVDPPRVASEFGGLPSQIDHPEVWNDWSGGYGFAYRHPADENSYFGFLANPNTYHWSENFDGRFPHQLIHCQQMLPLVHSKYASLNSNVVEMMNIPVPSLYYNDVAGQGGVYIRTTGAPTGTSGRLYPTGMVTDGSAFIVGKTTTALNGGRLRSAIFGSYIYPGNDGGDVFVQDTLDDNAAVTTVNSLTNRGWATAGNRIWTILGASGGTRNGVNSVAAGADPKNSSNYSATLNIGNGFSQINDMIAFKEQVFVGLDDGVYAGDQSGTFVNILDAVQGQVNHNNNRDMVVFNGKIVTQNLNGVYAYDPTITTTGQIREVGPNRDSNRGPVTGYVRAMETDGPWLYGALHNGSYSYLIAGQEINSTDPFTWHVLNRYPAPNRGQRIHIDSIQSASGGAIALPPRMWFATDNYAPTTVGGAAPLYYMPIPVLGGNPLVTSLGFTANYVGSARIDLGQADMRQPSTLKVFRSVEIQSENLVTGPNPVWCDVYYSVDGGPRTHLSTNFTSPRATIYFPDPVTTGTAIVGYSIELSMESYTTDHTITPIYRSITLRSTARPRSVDLITAVCDVSDQGRDRQGAPMRPGVTQLNQLRAMAQQGAPVVLVDLAGATFDVVVLSPVEEAEVYQAGTEFPQVAATVKLATMAFGDPAPVR